MDIRRGRDVDEVLARVREYVGEEGRGSGRMGEPWTVDDVLARAGERTRWLVDGYLPENGVVMLSGASGVGKSFLLSHLFASGEMGAPFLGRAVEPFEVLWYSEEPAAFLATKFRRFGLRRARLFTRDHLDAAPPWPLLVREAANQARRLGCKVIVFDPFPTWARHEGDDEQSSGAMTRALVVCMAVARDGLCVVLTHHDTRAGNPFRGSGAIKGALDVGLWLRLLDPLDPDGPRVLSVEKDRPVGGVKATTVRLDVDRYTALGNPTEAKAAVHKADALRLLQEAEPDGISAAKLAEALGIRESVAGTVARMVGHSTGRGTKTRWHPGRGES